MNGHIENPTLERDSNRYKELFAAEVRSDLRRGLSPTDDEIHSRIVSKFTAASTALKSEVETSYDINNSDFDGGNNNA